jgi:hypothetical protein
LDLEEVPSRFFSNFEFTLMLPPANQDELRIAVERDQFRAKPKFCVKLIRVLRYAASHPREIGELGCGWYLDHTHFICNSQILGTFLKLKPNSINTNLRDHSFVIDPFQSSDLITEFGALPDIKNWKVRHNAVSTWTAATTDVEADQIPAKEAPARGQLELVAAPPDPFSRLILERDEIRRDIQWVMKLAIGSDHWKEAVLRRVTEQWLRLTGEQPSIQHSALIHHIIESADPPIRPDSLGVVNANLRFLISAQSNASQMSEGISLLDFVRLTLRFGLIERIANNVFEISSPGYTEQHPFFLFSPGSQQEVDACFANWFVPSVDRNATTRILREGRSWIVRMSSSPNGFTVEAQTEEGLQFERFLTTIIH